MARYSFYLLLLFVVMPLTELFLLVKLAQATSFPTTVAIVLATGVIGVFTARVQGWLVWQKIQLDLRHARVPADGLIEGVALLIAGALLITPGLITDTIGFLLLIPPLRKLLRESIKDRFRRALARGEGRVFVFRSGSIDPDRGAVDVDHREIKDDPPNT